ncbi:unnamed protein product [Mycena citricolor]|uniref:Uncharacterized protein n=1 Tax=Mycena citricolor TaxID=2018698 RepID=A0AAD2K1X2_9AGAR|nr:unnamed protein product [Mycena citricolor]
MRCFGAVTLRLKFPAIRSTHCPALLDMDSSKVSREIAMVTGPMIIDMCLTWGFMGITLVQVSLHDRRRILHLLLEQSARPKNPRRQLSFLGILQTAMVTADASHWFVFGSANMIQRNDTFLDSWDVPMLDDRISLIVQLLYCWPRLAAYTSSARA